MTESGAAYVGQSLTFEGYVLVSSHGSYMKDPRCGRGVALSWSYHDRRFGALNRVARPADSYLQMVRIRATGEMKQDGHLGQREPRGWSLQLSAVQILSVRSLREEDFERYMAWLEGPSAADFRASR